MKLNITRETFEGKRSRKAQKNARPVREKVEANCVGTYAPASCVELSEKNIEFFESKKGQSQLARLDAKIEKQRDRATARKLAIEALVINAKVREYLIHADKSDFTDAQWSVYRQFIDVVDEGEHYLNGVEHYEFSVYIGQRNLVADCILKAALEDTCNALHDGQRWSFGEVCSAVRKLYGLFKWAAKKTHGVEQAAYEQLVERVDLNGTFDAQDAPGLKIARKLMAMLNRGTYRVTNGHGVVVGRI